MNKIDDSNFDTLEIGRTIYRLTENGDYFPYKIANIFNKEELHFEQVNHNNLIPIVGIEKTIPVIPAVYLKNEVISSEKWFLKE